MKWTLIQPCHPPQMESRASHPVHRVGAIDCEEQRGERLSPPPYLTSPLRVGGESAGVSPLQSMAREEGDAVGGPTVSPGAWRRMKE